MYRETSTDTDARRSFRPSRWPLVAVTVLAMLATVAACSSDEVPSPDVGDTPVAADGDDGAAGLGDPSGADDDSTSPTETSADTSTASPTASSTESPTGTSVGSAQRASACERGETGTRAGTEITVWAGLGGDQAPAAFDALVDEFEMWNPDVAVDAVPVVSPADARRRLREADPDDFPDLLMGGVDDTRLLAESGVFVPPSACWDGEPPVLDDLLPIIRSTVTVDGVLWSYPFNVSTPVLLYDRALVDGTDLEEIGVDADAGPTMAELTDVVAGLADSGAAPGGLVLYERSASWLIEQWAVRHGHVLVEPDNGRGGHPVDGVRFTTDEAVVALEWARGLYADGLVTWVGLNLSGLDDLFRLVDLDDRASFTMHTSAAIGDIVQLVHDEGVAGLDGAELGIAPLPSPTGASGARVGGASLWLVDNDDPVTVGAAARFAEFLMSPTSQAAFAAATGYVPATASAAAHPITESHWEDFPRLAIPHQQLASRGTSPAEVGMQIGPRVPVQRVLEEAAADVIVDGVDARDRLERAEREALDLIRQYELEQASPG